MILIGFVRMIRFDYYAIVPDHGFDYESGNGFGYDWAIAIRPPLNALFYHTKLTILTLIYNLMRRPLISNPLSSSLALYIT